MFGSQWYMSAGPSSPDAFALPAQSAVLTFIRQCEMQEVETEAIGRVEEVLETELSLSEALMSSGELSRERAAACLAALGEPRPGEPRRSLLGLDEEDGGDALLGLIQDWSIDGDGITDILNSEKGYNQIAWQTGVPDGSGGIAIVRRSAARGACHDDRRRARPRPARAVRPPRRPPLVSAQRPADRPSARPLVH